MRLRSMLSGLLMLGCGAAHAESIGSSPTSEPHLPVIPQPSLNFYGLPGLIDMPTAEMLPEGQFTNTVSYFAGQTRLTLTFQPTDWMMASFRYAGVPNLFNVSTLYDRSFDVRFRLLKEGRYRPGITLGLQDFAGTGIFSGEYIAATKNFETGSLGSSRLPGRLKVTAGLGWGRLGTHNSLGSTGARPVGTRGLGGQPSFDQWFRGPFAPFAGVEWQANDRLGFKLEYSSDAYVQETQDPTITQVFQRRSQVNFGVEYQATRRTRLGAYYLYGSEIGLSAQIQLSPYAPNVQPRLPAPYPVQPRPDPQIDPVAWSTEWTASSAAVAPFLRDQLAPLLTEEGLLLEALEVSAETAELHFRNLRYGANAVAIGRAARAMTRVMPASIEIFRLTLVSRGMPLSTVVIHRSDLEQLEFENYSSDQMLVETRFTDPQPLSDAAVRPEELYPNKSWSVAPYFTPGYFDPRQPFRLDVGFSLRGSYQPAPGWVISGRINQRIFGNLDGGFSLGSPSLPQVRTDHALYARYGTTLNQLYLARYWKPSPDLYARMTAGYFEYGYGGLSGELLWKPVNSRLALGVEVNYALKRDFNQLLGFQGYRVATGHASAYYDFENGFLAQVDVGRYLAGDVGATFSIDRVFNNGWSVGGFFTRTNVSAAEFGEGSFDKGIRFTIPVTWFLGSPSQRSVGTTIRPIQRDGGARVSVPGRLYQQVRGAHRNVLSEQWPRFWE